MNEGAREPVAELGRLIGEWTTEATHPMVPSTVVKGRTVFEWLEGEKFVIVRARTDHPDFPDSISVIGDTATDRVDESGEVAGSGDLEMHYFDSRGVHRIYKLSVSAESWECSREASGFSQRFAGSFEDGGDTISGLWKLSRDDETWDDDLEITYRRA